MPWLDYKQLCLRNATPNILLFCSWHSLCIGQRQLIFLNFEYNCCKSKTDEHKVKMHSNKNRFIGKSVNELKQENAINMNILIICIMYCNYLWKSNKNRAFWYLIKTTKILKILEMV